MNETDRDGKVATAESGTPVLIRERKGAVAILRLNRPEQRNGLDEALLTALQQSFVRLSAHRDVRAIVIAANGPVFCAGHDLKELTAHRKDSDGGRAFFEKIMGQCSTLMQSVMKCPKPVIAAVHATATAAGCQLVATCDLAVAADSAKFCTPGVNIGLFCSTPMVALSRNVPRKIAMEMLLLGEMLGAAEAAAYGLVNRVVPADKVLEEAMAMAERIASRSPVAVEIGKEAYYAQLELGVGQAYGYASEVMVHNMLMAEAEEGIGAFLEKRSPKWTGL
ncbi:MAG: enoyl-CoA hydratase [Hyphomicrobiaceae bacterium]